MIDITETLTGWSIELLIENNFLADLCKAGAALRKLLCLSVSHPLPPLALRPRQANTVENGTYSHKIHYVAQFRAFLISKDIIIASLRF